MRGLWTSSATPQRDVSYWWNVGEGFIMAVMGSEALLTRADRDALPEDGRRHELLDGAIVVTPSPGHRIAVWSRRRGSTRIAASGG